MAAKSRNEKRRGAGCAVLGAVLVASAIALAASVLLHLETKVGLRGVGDFMGWFVSNTSRGQASFGEVVSLPPGQLVLRDVTIRTAEGRTVLEMEQMSGYLAWGALLGGVARIEDGRVEGIVVQIDEGPSGQVAFIHAIEVPEDRFALPVELEDLEMTRSVAHVDLPGKPAITMRQIAGVNDIEVGHRFHARVDRMSGDVDLPVIDIAVSKINGRMQSDHRLPLVFRGEVDLEIVEPGFSVEYRAPGVVGEEGDPHLDLDFPAEVFPGLGEDEAEAREGREERQEEAREGREERQEEAREGREERQEEAQERRQAREEEEQERRQAREEEERERRQGREG
jgi:hypothetical protein